MIKVPMMVPGNGAFSSCENAGAPDDDGGDGVQFIGDSGVGISLMIFGCVEDAGESGEQAGERGRPRS